MVAYTKGQLDDEQCGRRCMYRSLTVKLITEKEGKTCLFRGPQFHIKGIAALWSTLYENSCCRMKVGVVENNLTDAKICLR